MSRVLPDRDDLIAIVGLLAASLILSAPVMGRGIVAYMDHPCHLAEVDSLARTMRGEGTWGWCDQAFCGFPLVTFQSPLWYGLLGLLAFIGIPPLAPYTLLVWLGFVAPSLALFFVARRVAPGLVAALLSFLLLIQPPALSGIESALGGMWTWHLGLAGVILLCGELALPGRRHVARVALLVGLVGLTHLMALAAAGLLFAAHALLRMAARGWRELGRDTLGALLGLLASAGFWLTFAMGSDGWGALRQDEPPRFLLGLLTLPWNVLTRAPDSALYFTDAIPMLTVLALGAASCVVIVRRRRNEPAAAVGGRGAAVAAATLMALLVVPMLPFAALGPLGWRFVHVARIALIVAAIPLAMTLVARWRPSRRAQLVVAVVAVASCVWWVRPLAKRAPSPDSTVMAMVENLWAWLAVNGPDDGSRVIVQDTFDALPSSPLYSGHVMALTGVRAGVSQVGAWYGGVPFQTQRWTQSEFGGVLGVGGRHLRDTRVLDNLRRRMQLVGGRVVVAVYPDVADALAALPDFEVRHRVGYMTVLEAPTLEVSRARSQTPGVRVAVPSFQSGRVRVSVDAAAPGGSVVVHAAWHRFWRLRAGDGANLVPGPGGLIELNGLPGGRSEYELAWTLPRSPWWISLLGWLSIATAALWRRDQTSGGKT